MDSTTKISSKTRFKTDVEKMSLIYFILCAYGLTQILVYAHIFDKIRPDRKFFKCSMCMGFWVGVFLYSINGYTDLFSFQYNCNFGDLNLDSFINVQDIISLINIILV